MPQAIMTTVREQIVQRCQQAQSRPVIAVRWVSVNGQCVVSGGVTKSMGNGGSRRTMLAAGKPRAATARRCGNVPWHSSERIRVGEQA
jgi:hypothetical protein